MNAMIGKVMNIEANGVFICRGLVTEVKGQWVTVREASGLTYEWPIGETYQLVEC